jgi:hypothetical protein
MSQHNTDSNAIFVITPKTMIPATGNNWNFTGTDQKITGSCRKRPENDEKWKQYSNRKIFGFSPVIYGRFLPDRTGS